MSTELETIRKHLKLTQAEMAAELGMSLRAYTEAERGSPREVHLKAARQVALNLAGDEVMPVNLMELAVAMQAAANRAATLPYQVEFSVERMENGPTVFIARGSWTNGAQTHGSTTGRPLADVLANPVAEFDYMFGFLDASLGAKIRGRP